MQRKVKVQLTKNEEVKHSKFISVMQAKQQSEQNAALYSTAQLAQADELTRAVQAVYFSKKVYKNLRKKFIVVKVADAYISNNLLLIAKKHNAKVVSTEANSVILRLFAK